MTIANRVVSIHEHGGHWVVMSAICGEHAATGRVVLEAAATLEEGGALAVVSGHYVVRRVVGPGSPIADIAQRVVALAASLETAFRSARDRALGVNAHYCL